VGQSQRQESRGRPASSSQFGRGTAVDAPHAFSAPAMPPSAKEPARVAPPRIAARLACRSLATPSKEVRPKARRTKLAITPRA